MGNSIIALVLLSCHIPVVVSNNYPQQVLHVKNNIYPRLNFSSPSPLIFHSTFSLLQQWSNTFYPNGHTIATGTIPQHTNLYHAHGNSSFPPSPEWFAFDASMAYAIFGELDESHLLTYRTTRPVKVLYFDGTSAALTDNGSMDTQMLVLYNNSASVPKNPVWGGPPRRRPNEIHSERIHNSLDDGPPQGPGHGRGPGRGHGGPPPGFNPLQGEYDRAEGLCTFIKDKDLGGPGWGFEGVVRMNAAFELIWCNFTSPSAQLVSWLNVSAPSYTGLPPNRGWGRGNSAFRARDAYEWFLSAARAYGFIQGMPSSGESRVKIDSCGLFSFYDPALEGQSRVRTEAERQRLNLTSHGFWQQPEHIDNRSAGLRKLSHRRRYQRATNVSVSDGLYMRQELEKRMRDTLQSGSHTCSGIDWVTVTQRILSDYSSEFLELRTVLSNSTPAANVNETRSWLTHIRLLTHYLYMPFYEYPTYTPSTIDHAFSTSHTNSLAALDRCKAQQSVLDSNQKLTRSENVTYNAILQTLSSICSVLLPVFLSTELIWLQNFNNISHLPDLTPELNHTIAFISAKNLRALEELTAWLGWDEQYTTCEPGCGLGQICAIPIWPVMGIGHFSGPDGGMGRRRPGQDESYDEYDNWLEAKCVEYESRPFDAQRIFSSDEKW